MAPKKASLNKRQDLILKFLDTNETASVSELLEFVQLKLGRVTKVTINRDLTKLMKLSFIVLEGAGRAATYRISDSYLLIKPFDADKYFEKEVDERKIKKGFNFDIFANFKTVLTEDEKNLLDRLNKYYLKKINQLPKDVIKKEFERLTIELSWKSSKIEGNTYSLLETEQLLKENKSAKGHTKHEAIMIQNHKKALDYIRSHLPSFKEISLKKIEEIHAILIQDLGVTKNIRNSLVGITGTSYKPLDNQFQISEALNETCDLVNKTENIFEKAVILILMIAYIQPFVDGNKRTSRLMGNAILLANNACPLSYRSIDEIEYKKAVLIFYEQNNLTYFKKLFLDQFEFVVENYFG